MPPTYQLDASGDTTVFEARDRSSTDQRLNNYVHVERERSELISGHDSSHAGRRRATASVDDKSSVDDRRSVSSGRESMSEKEVEVHLGRDYVVHSNDPLTEWKNAVPPSASTGQCGPWSFINRTRYLYKYTAPTV